MLSWITGINGARAITADVLSESVDGITIEKSVITSIRGEQIPFIRLIPANWDGQRACLALGSDGKDCVDEPAIRQMLQEGICVISGDLFMTGEFEGVNKQPETGKGANAYFTTFHYTTNAYRTQDTALLWQVATRFAPECSIWACGSAARAAACAIPLLNGVKKAQLEGSALSLEGDEAYFNEFFIPGIMLVGGIQGCLELADCNIELF